MVDTRSDTNRTHEETIKTLFMDGLSVQEVHELVSTIATEIEDPPTHNGHVDEVGVPIHQEIPDGLLTLDGAEAQFGVNRRTLQSWVQRKRLRVYARLKAPGRGDGKTLVATEEVRMLLNNPPRPGRPGGFRPNRNH